MQEALKNVCYTECDETSLNDGTKDNLKPFLRNSITSVEVHKTQRNHVSIPALERQGAEEKGLELVRSRSLDLHCVTAKQQHLKAAALGESWAGGVWVLCSGCNKQKAGWGLTLGKGPDQPALILGLKTRSDTCQVAPLQWPFQTK